MVAPFGTRWPVFSLLATCKSDAERVQKMWRFPSPLPVRCPTGIKEGFRALGCGMENLFRFWNGGPLPTTSSPLYLPIADEIAERLAQPGDQGPPGGPRAGPGAAHPGQPPAHAAPPPLEQKPPPAG